MKIFEVLDQFINRKLFRKFSKFFIQKERKNFPYILIVISNIWWNKNFKALD